MSAPPTEVEEKKEGRISILGVQIANIDATDAAGRASNIARACDLIRRHPGHDIYLLPELSSLGYSDDVLRNVAELSERVEDGPSRVAFSALAKEMNAHVAFGFARDIGGEKGEEKGQKPTICHAVAHPDGVTLATVYDKLNLCSFGACSESLAFSAGSRLCCFDVRGVRVGLLICYDLRFPEPWRALGDAGCAVVLHPSAFPDDGSFASWHPFVRCRAAENGISVVSVNRAHAFHGESVAMGPDPFSGGNPPLERDEGVLRHIVDIAEMERVRRAFPFGTDARGDYKELAEALGRTLAG